MFRFLREKKKQNHKPETDGSARASAAVPFSGTAEENASAEHNGEASQSAEKDGIIISYRKTTGGADNAFALFAVDYHPPEEQFQSFMTESEREKSTAIWFLCLLCRHGMLLQSEPAQTFDWGNASWTYSYELNINGVPTLMTYEDYEGCLFFVALEYADKRESVVRTLCDLIVREGRSITYAEWKKQRQDGRIKL